MPLKVRLLSALMIAIPLLVVSYFFVYENIQERRVAETEKNIMITRSAAFLVDNTIREHVELLERFAKLPAFQHGTQEEVQTYLDIFQAGQDEGYFVANVEGMLVAQNVNRSLAHEVDLRDYPFFQQALKETVISNQHNSLFTDEFVINICVPVITDSGKVTRVLGVQLSNEFFAKRLDPIKVGQVGFLSLVDSQGFYIYDKTIATKKELVESRCFHDGIGEDLTVVERPSLRDREMTIFTKVRIKSLDWYVVAFQPSRELTAPVLATVTKNVLTLVLVFVVLLVLSQYRKSLMAHEELVQRQTAEKMALVGGLAAGMAHEIRNPLTTIKGFTRLLRAREQYSKDREVFDSINQSVLHIENLINEILLMSKPQKLNMKHISLQEVGQEVITELAGQATAKGIDLRFDKGEQLTLVKGDEKQLKQMLFNVAKNALEATGQGGQVRISLSCPSRLMAKVEVSDSGEGIRPEDFGKIGTPFFTTKDTGTGLGLMICQSIVEEHGGAIEIKSTFGEGTTVEIFLPSI